MRTTRIFPACTIVLSLLLGAWAQTNTPATTRYDIVIANGRVIDPETRLDAVRNVGIKDGKIAAVSNSPLKGERVIDATGLLVAPGFIDWHAHGQNTLADRVQAFDGVTTALELEAGMLPTDRWYDLQARSKRILNYGASSSWGIARMAALESIPLPAEPRAAALFANFRLTKWPNDTATPEQLTRIVNLTEQGLQEGGLGIGLVPGYAPYQGKRLNESSFKELRGRNPGAIVVLHFYELPRDQKLLDMAVLFSGGIIASDAMPWLSTETGREIDSNAWPLPNTAFAHPRSAGTFTRFLAQYVRDRKLISWPDAITKTSYLPAKYLEETAPQMEKKGRLQVGKDADIVVFDPATLRDQATYERPNQTSVGMRYVLVNGAFVIRNGELDTSAFPGRPVRRTVTP